MGLRRGDAPRLARPRVLCGAKAHRRTGLSAPRQKGCARTALERPRDRVGTWLCLWQLARATTATAGSPVRESYRARMTRGRRPCRQACILVVPALLPTRQVDPDGYQFAFLPAPGWRPAG